MKTNKTMRQNLMATLPDTQAGAIDWGFEEKEQNLAATRAAETAAWNLVHSLNQTSPLKLSEIVDCVEAIVEAPQYQFAVQSTRVQNHLLKVVRCVVKDAGTEYAIVDEILTRASIPFSRSRWE